jgi:hypothetical protein
MLKTWILDVEIMSSWCWNREFLKVKSWLLEVEIVNSWIPYVEKRLNRVWCIHEKKIGNSWRSLNFPIGLSYFANHVGEEYHFVHVYNVFLVLTYQHMCLCIHWALEKEGYKKPHSFYQSRLINIDI